MSLDESAVGLTWVVDEPIERASQALVDQGRVWLVDPTDDRAALERVLDSAGRRRRSCSSSTVTTVTAPRWRLA